MPLSYNADIWYDAGPTGCGELIMNLFFAVKKMESGQVIEVVSHDAGAREDIPAWCRLQGNTLLQRREKGGVSHFYIRKGK